MRINYTVITDAHRLNACASCPQVMVHDVQDYDCAMPWMGLLSLEQTVESETEVHCFLN